MLDFLKALPLLALVSSVFLFSSQPALAQFSQQGPKLVGTGGVGAAHQGASVALSSDGNTAIVGGYGDNGSIGATWVFTRSGGDWSQQGSKLVANDYIGAAQQGVSVALSADGNTAIVGGHFDNGQIGAAWVFIRSGGVWTQQGSKLFGTGAVGAALQSVSVALSADGNTAIVGGPHDSGGAGAAWVFIRSGGVWTQQGSKLVGTGASGLAGQGAFVSLSADGNTAIVGGPFNNGNAGAAWVFTRSGAVWTQQGSRLVGSGAVGNALQGWSVGLSGDGNTAIVEGYADSSNAGAAWVYTRSGGIWTQQGSKLAGSGAVGSAEQGRFVSLASDGNTAIVGGYADSSNAGAAWVYTRSRGIWTQQGSKLAGSGAVGNAQQGYSVSLSADGNTAIVGGFGDDTGLGAAWVYVTPPPPPPPPPLACPSPSRLADFNADAKADLLFRRNDGLLAVYLMNGLQVASANIIGQIGVEFTLVGIGDFNGDGNADLLFRRGDDLMAMYLMNGAQLIAAQALGNLGVEWTVIGVGDFNGDGKARFPDTP